MKRIGIFFIGITILVVFSYRVTFALFSDSATSANNTFTAAAVFPSPSVFPSVFPSISPSLSPTPTPQNSNLYVSNGFTCATGASSTSTIKGSVSITKTSTLSISVNLTNASPNTTYSLWVNQNPGACPLPAATVSSFITTDGSGNGSNTLNNHTLVNTATAFWVSLVGGSDVFRSQAVNL